MDENQYYWPYEFEIYNLKKEPSFIIAFIPSFDINEDLSNLSFIKKFQFQSFDDNAYNEINSVEYKNYVGSRIINAFLMDDVNTFVVLAYKKIEVQTDTRRRVSSSCINNNYKYIFYLNFYNNNIAFFFYIKEIEINSNYLSEYSNYLNECSNNNFPGCSANELLIKSLYLNGKYVLFIFFDWDCFIFNLFKLDNSQRKEIFNPEIEDERKPLYDVLLDLF